MAVDSRMNQMLAAIVRTQTCESCWMHWMRLECQMASVTCPAKCREFKSKSNDKIGNHGHMSWRFGLRLNPTWFHGGTLSLQLAMPPSGRKDSGVWKGGRTESTLQNIIRICVYIYININIIYIYIYIMRVCVFSLLARWGVKPGPSSFWCFYMKNGSFTLASRCYGRGSCRQRGSKGPWNHWMMRQVERTCRNG